MQMSGTISSLRIHPTYVVFDSFTDNQGEKHRSIRYIADFEYIQDGKYIVEDVKGGSATQTAVFRIKRKMFLARYRDRALRIVEV
jgi:hypothetical protein